MTDVIAERLPSAGEMRAAAAGRIALEVRESGGNDHFKLAKVSSLLRSFRVPGSSPRFSDVQEALRAHGIRLDSGWVDESGSPQIRQAGVLRLTELDFSASVPVTKPIKATLWRTGEVGHAYPLSALGGVRAEGDVMWFDIDPPVRPGQLESRAQDVASQLDELCPSLDVGMVRDLLREDLQPKVESYGDEQGDVRSVSVVAAIARELPGALDDLDRVSEQLVFQVVELIVGEGWIVSCWHPSQVHSGDDQDGPTTSLLKEPFLSHVRDRWVQPIPVDSQQGRKTSSDLGIFLVESLVDTYKATHRMMERWMATWEVEFYTSLRSNDRAEKLRAAAGDISDFLYLTAEIRRKLTAFRHARYSTADRLTESLARARSGSIRHSRSPLSQE